MTTRFRAVALLGLAVAACHSSHQGGPTPVAPVPEPGERSNRRSAEISANVTTSDGVAVANAVVAINGVGTDWSEIGVTDATGKLRFPRPTGPFALTVTSEAGTAAFVAHVDTESHPTLQIQLAPVSEAFTIEGSLSLGSGLLPPDTFVLAARSSEDEGDLFKVPVSKSGAFKLHVPPGSYSLRPTSQDLLARWTSTKGAAGDTRTLDIEVGVRGPAPKEVTLWLEEHALPIATTDVGSDTSDIAELATLLAEARVIGVGEATHGTREFFRFKHRLLERLVEHHDLTLLAMEANFADAERIDAWVRGGEGTVEDAMKGVFVVWRTEEIRDVLVWMREWNANPTHKRKIGFRGYDVQGAGESISALRAYFQRVDPAGEQLLTPLEPLQRKPNSRAGIELTEAEAEATRVAVAAVAERLAGARRRYVGRSSASEHALMLQHARAVEQARARFAGKDWIARFAARDLAMAQNVVWLAEQIPADERVLVWAHNGHIQIAQSTLPATNMGMHLREHLGRDYLPVGFVLGEGTYRAWVKPTEPVIADVTVGPREPGWVAEAFAQAGPPNFAIDLRTAETGPARDWLFSPQILHSCGWLVSEQESKGSIDVLGRLFDVAIYLDRTSSARQLKRG